jgi:hypothetical protein
MITLSPKKTKDTSPVSSAKELIALTILFCCSFTRGCSLGYDILLLTPRARSFRRPIRISFSIFSS